MPEGPECTLHAEFLDAACTGMYIHRASILSGRYLGEGRTPGRGAPPDNWEKLERARVAPSEGAIPVTFYDALAWQIMKGPAKAADIGTVLPVPGT